MPTPIDLMICGRTFGILATLSRSGFTTILPNLSNSGSIIISWACDNKNGHGNDLSD